MNDKARPSSHAVRPTVEPPPPVRRGRVVTASSALCAVVLLFAAAMDDAWAKRFYRWVDAQGNVQYSDKVPSEAAGASRKVINDQGVTVDVTKAAKTPEQIREERRQARIRAEQRRIADAQAARDRVLIQTFGSVDDMEMTRNGKVAAVEALIRITTANLNSVRQSMKQFASRAAEYERSGKPVPKHLRDTIDELQRRMRDNDAFIAARQAEQEAIRQQFAADIARFKELKSKKIVTSAPRRIAPGPEGVAEDLFGPAGVTVRCKGKSDCDRAWSLSQLFVRKHATRPIQLVTEALITTLEPSADEDIGMMVAHYPEAGEGGRLVLDVVCYESEAGQELCRSSAVQRIKTEYKSYIESGGR